MNGWRFFPERPPGPVDDAYVQRTWVRPYPVGVLRWLVGGLLGVATAFAAFSGLLLALSARGAADLVVAALAAAAAVGSLGWVTARVLTTGVWVNDAGVRVSRLLRTTQHRWAEVAEVAVTGSGVRRAVLLRLDDGRAVPCPLRAGGLDSRGAEAFDIAAEAVARWHLSGRGRSL